MLRSNPSASLRTLSIGAALGLFACAPEAGKPQGPPDGAFSVSDYFAPSGAMGDGELPENLAIDDNRECKARPSGARGHCYRFVYTAGELLWSGVYWQYPANNWGADPGLPLPAGLARVTFRAAVESGPELVKFVIGGVGVPRAAEEAALYPYDDQFKVEVEHTLTTDFQRFEIAIPAASTSSAPIERLIGAFAWFMNHPPGSDPAAAPLKTLYVDDLVYE